MTSPQSPTPRPDVGEDIWAADRLSALGFLIEGEHKIYNQYVYALTRWLDYMRPRVLSGAEKWQTIDPVAVPGGAARWAVNLAKYVVDAVAWVLRQAFERVLGPQDDSFTSRPWVAQHLADVTNRVTRTPDWLFEHLRAEIDVGTSAGEGIPEIAGRVEAALLDANAPLWVGRAQTIARTETLSAYNGGTQAAFEVWAEVFGDPLEKVWLASMDPRTRDSHFAADGQRVPSDQPFLLSGIFTAMYPGDPELPPGERINCRCSVLYVEPGEDVDMSNRGVRGDKSTADEVASRADRGIIRARDVG